MANVRPEITPRLAPSLFGIDAQHINIFDIKLDAALSNDEINTGASTVLWVLGATSLTATAEVKFNRQAGRGMDISKGLFVRGIPFSKLYVTCAAQPGESLTILCINELEIGFEISNPSASAALFTLTKPTIIDTVADVACAAAATTQVLAANAARRQAHISNLSAAITCRIGDANTGAARGILLNPLDTVGLEGTESIHVFNPGPGAISVGVAWEED